jgi:hypothetical protein
MLSSTAAVPKLHGGFITLKTIKHPTVNKDRRCVLGGEPLHVLPAHANPYWFLAFFITHPQNVSLFSADQNQDRLHLGTRLLE